MPATAEVALPLPSQLFGKETSGGVCCSPLTGVTEPSNDYHTHRNTRASTQSTHKTTTPLSCGERTGGGRSAVAADIVYSQDFHYISFVLSAFRPVELSPDTPPFSLLHSYISPLCGPGTPNHPPLILLMVFLLFTRTLLTQQNTPVPSPMLSAGAHFSLDMLSSPLCGSVCICEHC